MNTVLVAPPDDSSVRKLTCLQSLLKDGGWQLEYFDIDLTSRGPALDVRMSRNDGRFVLARVDAIGRATLETFQRSRRLVMCEQTAGRRPLTPEVSDEFLGRQRCLSPRHLVKQLTHYLVDNATGPVTFSQLKAAWGPVLATSTVIGAICR